MHRDAKHLLPILLVLAVVGFLGCDGSSTTPARESAPASKGAPAEAGARCPHDIKQDRCPFCTPTLLASEGFCGEHGVAEALCSQCRPYLKAAFRAKGDWCAEHDVPESQCVICHPDLKANLKPGEHGVAPKTSGGK